ncbi:MAG TPA: sigma 54-interacting transcriptional regulator, partial [Cyclobacteriaceae bacterium]|nr:sigma 54-interacting transcriptional regulator [Cyclobacteriaceae bacterium]
MMEYIEQLILQYHNGIAGQGLSSRIIDLCWKSNDFLDGYLFFLHNRDVTAVDFYVLLTALNGNNCARHSMELLDLALNGKQRNGAVIGCWDHGSLNQLYRDLKSWGQIILLETQSIMQILQPTQIEQQIGLNENKKEPEKELYLAYLKRSLIFSRRNYSKDDISYDEVKQLFSEVAGLFEKYSQFELMRTWLYEARMEGSIDRARSLAEKAQRIALELGFTRYKTLAKDELQRRSTQIIIRDGAFTEYFEKLKQELMSSETADQLFQVTGQVLRRRIIGQPIRSFSFLESDGQDVRVVYKAEEEGEFVSRRHVINSRYILVVPPSAHWVLVEDLVQVLRVRLAQLENESISQDVTVIKDDLIVYSSRMDAFVNRCREVIHSPNRAIPILITGETGTGKSWLAEKLHSLCPLTQRGGLQHWFASENRGGDVNMFKSNLFGFVAGFANHLKKDQPGKVQLAQDGSFIMDEIGELELDRQAVLLQLLNNWKYERVGDPTTCQANCRIYLATNRNLKQMVLDGTFREDLYFRISMDNLHVPPLRLFPEQIIPLARDFSRQEIQNFNQVGMIIPKEVIESGIVFTREATERLLNYSWPGNVRQLKLFLRMLVSTLLQKQNYVVNEEVAEQMFSRLQEMDPFSSFVKKDSARISFDQEKNKIRFQEMVTRVFGPPETRTEEQNFLVGLLGRLEPVKVNPSLLLRLERNSKALIEKLRKPRKSNQKSKGKIGFSEIQEICEAYLLMQYYLNLIVYEYKFNDSQLFNQAGTLSWPRSFRRLYLSEV